MKSNITNTLIKTMILDIFIGIIVTTFWTVVISCTEPNDLYTNDSDIVDSGNNDIEQPMEICNICITVKWAWYNCPTTGCTELHEVATTCWNKNIYNQCECDVKYEEGYHIVRFNCDNPMECNSWEPPDIKLGYFMKPYPGDPFLPINYCGTVK